MVNNLIYRAFPLKTIPLEFESPGTVIEIQPSTQILRGTHVRKTACAQLPRARCAVMGKEVGGQPRAPELEARDLYAGR